jgi:hypothetical protein
MNDERTKPTAIQTRINWRQAIAVNAFRVMLIAVIASMTSTVTLNVTPETTWQRDYFAKFAWYSWMVAATAGTVWGWSGDRRK